MKDFFSLFTLVLLSTSLYAYDFEKDGIYYNILSSDAVEVTYGSYETYAPLYNVNGEYQGDITIPATVSYDNTTYNVGSIGDMAFCLCEEMTSISIPTSVTSIGSSAFDFCLKLTTITIPNSITSIGKYAFNHCDSLKTIMLPDHITYISEGTFIYCFALSTITIPSDVTSIGDWAFGACDNLTEITCLAITPPTIGGNDTFRSVNRSIPLYVPAQSIEAYKTANGWKEFTNIQSIDFPNGVENVTSNTTDAIRKVYENGQLVIIRDGVRYNVLGARL